MHAFDKIKILNSVGAALNLNIKIIMISVKYTHVREITNKLVKKY